MCFKNKREIANLQKDKFTSHSYRWKPLNINEGYEVWLKYYAGDKLRDAVFNLKSICPSSLPHAYIYLRKTIGAERRVFSYEYENDVTVQRISDGENIVSDTITNITDVIRDTNDLIQMLEKTQKFPTH